MRLFKDDYERNQYFKNIKTFPAFYLQVSALYGNNLGTLNNTIFLGEIQTYPNLLTLLKALRQDNRYRYIASGSLFGITMRNTFIPMGSNPNKGMLENLVWFPTSPFL